jgi:hypothetical protein
MTARIVDLIMKEVHIGTFSMLLKFEEYFSISEHVKRGVLIPFTRLNVTFSSVFIVCIQFSFAKNLLFIDR